MTRFLYDVAVITDYSRRKFEANEPEISQHEPQKDCIRDSTSDHTNNMLFAKPGQAGKSGIQPKTAAKQMPPTTSEMPIYYEIANSVSDYSSVGTLSSTGTTSSLCSLDLAKILWTNVDDTEETTDSSTNPNKYETCSQSIDSAMEDTSLHADLVASPSILNQKMKKKKSTLAYVNKEIFPYFKSSQAQRKTTVDGDVNSMAVDVKGSQDIVGSLQNISLAESRVKNEDKILEANLRRVAEQLYEFDPQIALISSKGDPLSNKGSEAQQNIQICNFIGKSVSPQNVSDVYDGHGFHDSDHCQNRKEGTQLLQPVYGDISSADDMWLTACSEWSESFSQPHSNVSSRKGNRSTEQHEYVTREEHVNHQIHNVARNTTNDLNNVTEHDIGICLDGTDLTKDASHIQVAQSSVCNASVDRLTKMFASNTLLTVNDSGFINSIYSQNMTNNNTFFLQNRSIGDRQGALPSEKDGALKPPGNIKDINAWNLTQRGQRDSQCSKPLVIHKTEDDASPYHCKVRHGRDFQEFSRFVSSNCLPERVLTENNISSLISVSQRIVRIRVSKSYMPADPSFEINDLDPCALPKDSVKNTGSEVNGIPVTDHYGTGFVFYVDSEQFEVRTHSRLVSSAVDAEKTEIQFSVYVPETGQWLRVNCKGQANGFQINIYSHTSILTCPTPPVLESLLPYFKNIPIKLKTSVFNDSSYFTDSSPEASFSIKDFLTDPLLEMQGIQKDNNSNEKEFTSLRTYFAESKSTSENLSEHGSVFLNNGSESSFGVFNKDGDQDKDLSFDQIANSGSSSYDLEEFDDDSHMGENPFEYCGLQESVVRSAFESVMETDDLTEERDYNEQVKNLDDNRAHNWNQSRKPNASLSSYPSCSRSSTLPTGSSGPGHGMSTLCREIPGVKGYQLFDNHAGNVLGTSILSSGIHINGSILDMPLGKWDHESMLYIQNQCRDEYNLVFNTSKNNTHITHLNNAAPGPWDGTKDNRKVKNGSCSQEGIENPRRSRLDVFNNIHTQGETSQTLNPKQPFSKALPNNYSCLSQSKSNLNLAANFDNLVETESDSWDWDLLGLDSKLLFTTISDIEMEKLVDDILSDDSEDGTPSALSNEYLPAIAMNSYENIALLVAHPHGGFKTVSCGKLSAISNTTPDGKLYDLPTCFGCCGAPVLSFNENGELYVTTLVHNGTTSLGDKGPSKGFGVCYYTQSANEFSQCTTI